MTNHDIDNKIKKVRELKSYTQEYMAERLQMSQTAYGRIERGETDINYSKLQQIADVLSLRVNDIIDFNDKVIFNITNHASAEKSIESINNAYIMGDKDAMERERKLYENQIDSLKLEVEHLKGIIDFLKKEK